MAGKATGERIRGSIYRLICRLAIEGHTTNQIATQAKVSFGTAKAIIERESKTIGERKKDHADACLRVAHQALERLEDQLHTINPGSLATITGILTDKASALTSQPEGNPNLHLHLHSIDVISSFNQMLHTLPSAQPKLVQSIIDPARDAHARDASTEAEQTAAKAELIEATLIEPTQSA